MKKLFLFLIILGIIANYGCATKPANIPIEKTNALSIADKNPAYSDDYDDYDDYYDEFAVTIKDPLYKFNKTMFKFNDRFYFWALKPVCRFYTKAVPHPVRLGLKNFFFNVCMPIRFLNSLLQIKVKKSGTELLRFSINSTIGVLGFFDNAENFFGISAPKEEDFGQTLGRYGVGSGVYLVIPFLGPSSSRDLPGTIIDAFLNPVYYIDPSRLAIETGAIDKLNGASFDYNSYEELKKIAIDPYESLKDAYVQLRLKEIKE